MAKNFKNNTILIHKGTGKKFKVIKREKIPLITYFGGREVMQDSYVLQGTWKRSAKFHQSAEGVHQLYTKEVKRG